jgi:hypothetical protein
MDSRLPDDSEGSPDKEVSAANRRKYARIATEQVISFSHLDSSDRLAFSKNLSSGGIRFEAVGCEFELGNVVRVTFNIGDQTLVAVGRVVWATEIDPITLDVGIEFIEIDQIALELLEEAIADEA